MEDTKSSADSNATSGSSKTGHAIVGAAGGLNGPLGQLENTTEQFACQFKGVVPQHNKKWGAQIYVSHGRVWLGTFITQEAAALAYDRACLKFRGLECQKNFLSKEDCQIEMMFQGQYKEEHVVQMIREHTYEEHLNEFMGNMGRDKFLQNQSKLHLQHHHHDNTIPQHLFDKEVTPSDVGKLNRLVIPKQHAERNFPRESQIKDKDESLVFVDVENNKEWEFRYSFWKSSQSYVLTRGWSKFVKEKRLEAGDIVSFQRCNSTGRLYITVNHRYRRNTAVSSDIIIGRPPNFLMPPPPFGRSEFWVVVNDRPMQFYNTNPGLLNYGSSVVPLHMGYSSRGLHGIPNVSGNDSSRDLREQSFFPVHGKRSIPDNNNEMGLAANGGSNSVRLFGVDIGASVPDSD